VPSRAIRLARTEGQVASDRGKADDVEPRAMGLGGLPCPSDVLHAHKFEGMYRSDANDDAPSRRVSEHAEPPRSCLDQPHQPKLVTSSSRPETAMPWTSGRELEMESELHPATSGRPA